MPIRRELKWHYPLDWPQISAMIRFGRAQGRCEGCGRRHGKRVAHLGNGQWWDDEQLMWRSGAGRVLRRGVGDTDLLGRIRFTRVVLATAHRDHDPGHNRPRNLAAFCQRCHLAHDRAEHRRRRWMTLFQRKAVGDLFLGRYPLGFGGQRVEPR